MARIVIDLTEAEKAAIVNYADQNKISIKKAVLGLLSKKITDLQKKD